MGGGRRPAHPGRLRACRASKRRPRAGAPVSMLTVAGGARAPGARRRACGHVGGAGGARAAGGRAPGVLPRRPARPALRPGARAQGPPAGRPPHGGLLSVSHLHAGSPAPWLDQAETCCLQVDARAYWAAAGRACWPAHRQLASSWLALTARCRQWERVASCASALGALQSAADAAAAQRALAERAAAAEAAQQAAEAAAEAAAVSGAGAFARAPACGGCTACVCRRRRYWARAVDTQMMGAWLGGCGAGWGCADACRAPHRLTGRKRLRGSATERTVTRAWRSRRARSDRLR